jgi:AcrR family transcriptional regulator
LRYTAERFTVARMPVAADAPAAGAAAAGNRAGRPRDPQVDAAIRAATLELLVEEGYQATTIQAVARRAGVSAPSIYRRWSSKAELVEAAVFPSDLVEPTGGAADVSVELADYCHRILSYLAQPPVRAAIPGLLTEYQTDPQMWQRLTARTLMPMRTSFEAFLHETGREPSGSVEALFEVMMGALFARALNVGAEGGEEFAQQVALIATSALQTQPTTQENSQPQPRRRRRPFERAR